MMGNNLQALNAKTLTKHLMATKPNLTKTNDRQLEVHPPRNGANTESTRSDYSVTHTQLSSTYGSGYLKETNDGLSAMKVSTKHLNSCGVLNNTSNDSNASSFVYYVPPKPNKSDIVPQDNRENTVKRHSMETTKEARKMTSAPNQSNKTNVTSKKTPIVVDLTLDDSDDDEGEAIVQEPPNTLPKILAAYSLNSKHSSFPATEIRSLLSQRAKENLVKQNGLVISNLPNIKPKPMNTSIPDVTEPQMKNGVINEPKNDVISSNGNDELIDPIATFRNDVMNDVTNIRNGDLSSTKKPEYKPMVFSSWSVNHGGNVESCRQGVATVPKESGDQVVITKVITSTERSHGRRSHPRKAPIQVRKLYFDEKTKEKEVDQAVERDKNQNSKSFGNNESIEQTNTGGRNENCGLETAGGALFNGNTYGTPWSFSMIPDQSIHYVNNAYREDKIRNLKDRLAKQQVAVEKLRIKEKGTLSSQVNGHDRVLVVQIPDLKSKLKIRTEEKQSFRVIDRCESVKTNNGDLTNKRKRKTLPRKVSREPSYPSHVKNRISACYDSDDDDESYVPNKRTRVRMEKESIAKQRMPRRPRGRCSPVNVKLNQIPVVTKDLWHREMEKVEAELALSNQPIDKTSFMLFLGLRKVEIS